MTTANLLITLARPLAASAWAWLIDGSEVAIVEKPEVDRIVAEYQQPRALALASDIDLIHEEMVR